MLFSFLITLREGFEIALVLAIVLGYLARTGNRAHFGRVWLGAGLAVALSSVVVVALEVTSRDLSPAASEAFEGVMMLVAVVVLTWMVFWMRRQAAGIGAELRRQVNVALSGSSRWGLAGLAFLSVMREGIETGVFLFAGSTTASGSPAMFWFGAVAGFAVAAALGYVVYRGSHRLPLRQFFTVSGIAVLVIAAGMVSNGIAELQESGFIANLGSRPWDTDSWLSLTDASGKFFHTLLGYDPAPTWGQIALFWGYLVSGVAFFLFWPHPTTRLMPAPAGTNETPTPSGHAGDSERQHAR
ncbi:MAG: FTR1 family protein [Dehalococcoidia bacterium]